MQVLTYGLLSAAFLRLSLIVIGAELVTNFQPVLLVFAGILLYSSYGLIAKKDEDDDGDLSDNQIVKACRYIINLLLCKSLLGYKVFDLNWVKCQGTAAALHEACLHI